MRPAAATLAAGLALAIGTPTAWVLTRPDAAAGAPVSQVLAAPASPTHGAGAATSPPTRPPVPAYTTDAPGSLPAAPQWPTVPTRDAGVLPTAPAVAPPSRLVVPDLRIDAPVDPVGVTGDGSMAIPGEVDRVGWYRFGAAPAAGQGTTVLAGHVDDWQQGAGALLPLRRAEPGQEVQVTDAAGATTRWRVVARDTISKRELPVDQLFRRDGPPRLVLLTCGGPFLERYRSYQDNVVVVAEPLP
jgi:hypothetical protein